MQLVEFKPILKRIRWGGRKLGTILGKPISDADDYAESWEIADYGQDQSIVLDGTFQGLTLHELVRRQNGELFGIHAGLEQFPLLIKFLDARDRLSVQVHPNDEQARGIDPRENGKTEAWIILEADPHSVIYAGLKPEVTRETFESNLKAGTVESCLHCFEVSPGDCVFIPAGTVHAIGEGILLAEIQQSSDVTFRLFDWGRLGTDGSPREIHIDESLQCIDFDRGPVNPVVPHRVSTSGSDVEELVRSDYFVIRRHRTSEPFSIVHDNRFHILMMLRGNAELICDTQRKNVRIGSTVLMPADASDVRVVPDGEIILLETFLPD
ncbi:MAG: class I mannose-6-phosphate isomerase [Planctomycetes bacterium]|nr:class I mannose-6-phosphate isomerase [Planctomycetota bacterium]